MHKDMLFFWVLLFTFQPLKSSKLLTLWGGWRSKNNTFSKKQKNEICICFSGKNIKLPCLENEWVGNQLVKLEAWLRHWFVTGLSPAVIVSEEPSAFCPKGKIAVCVIDGFVSGEEQIPVKLEDFYTHSAAGKQGCGIQNHPCSVQSSSQGAQW